MIYSTFVPLCFLAYLVGAFPVGYIIARLKGIDDIRRHGSGTIGATNVSRLLGIHYFFIIFVLDAGKAFCFISFMRMYCSFDELCTLAFLLLFGNGCSLFLRGSGGKGIATTAGLLLHLQPFVVPILLIIWLLLLCITHIVGIASIGAVLCLPICAYATDSFSFFVWSLGVTIFIIWLHRSNVQLYLKKCLI